ncbi:MAG: ATP-binding protein [Pirellulales bacterium]
MLIEFRVENHRSLRDEQALTLEVGRVAEGEDLRPRRVNGHSELLLPAVGIYGPNASGKSNVLAAIAFMREAVLHSHRRWEPEGGIPRTAFAWGGNRQASSMFEASFVANGTRFEYGFCVNDEIVEEEWLFAWPNSRKQVWFEREADSFRFGDLLKGPNEAVKEVTRKNALFLSAAAQHSHQQLTPLYMWFRSIFPVNIPGRGNSIFPSPFMPEPLFASDAVQLSLFPTESTEETLAAKIRQLLLFADVGIVDIKRLATEGEYRGRTIRRNRILLQHQVNNDESWLELDEESEGTKTLFRMAPAVFRALETGGLLLVDELESSLHPLIGLAIVKLFNCPRANPNNAQVLFTTHDTNLLGPTIGKPPLRRDQIWFTEKDNNGATKLYPLTDYKPRKAENLERGYLQGRYGAIPFLGDITWITE